MSLKAYSKADMPSMVSSERKLCRWSLTRMTRTFFSPSVSSGKAAFTYFAARGKTLRRIIASLGFAPLASFASPEGPDAPGVAPAGAFSSGSFGPPAPSAPSSFALTMPSATLESGFSGAASPASLSILCIFACSCSDSRSRDFVQKRCLKNCLPESLKYSDGLLATTSPLSLRSKHLPCVSWRTSSWPSLTTIILRFLGRERRIRRGCRRIRAGSEGRRRTGRRGPAPRTRCGCARAFPSPRWRRRRSSPSARRRPRP